MGSDPVGVMAPADASNIGVTLMSKSENDANNVLRPPDSPMNEYEKEKIAQRKNFERLKAERLAREAAGSKKD